MCLNDDQRAALHGRLMALKAELLENGYLAMTPNRQDDAGRRDEDFQPLNEMNQVLQSNKNQTVKKTLGLIDSALARFIKEPDLIGACEACEECISVRRLEILPYAILCVKCQSELETEGDTSLGRRNLTDFRT